MIRYTNINMSPDLTISKRFDFKCLFIVKKTHDLTLYIVKLNQTDSDLGLDLISTLILIWDCKKLSKDGLNRETHHRSCFSCQIVPSRHTVFCDLQCTVLLLPYCGTYVVVKMILNESANNAGFPDSGVLETQGRTSVTAQTVLKPIDCPVTCPHHQMVHESYTYLNLQTKQYSFVQNNIMHLPVQQIKSKLTRRALRFKV